MEERVQEKRVKINKSVQSTHDILTVRTVHGGMLPLSTIFQKVSILLR